MGVVVGGGDGGGGIADENFGTVFLTMFVWCIFVLVDERQFPTWTLSPLLLISVKFDLLVFSNILVKSLFTKFLSTCFFFLHFL